MDIISGLLSSPVFPTAPAGARGLSDLLEMGQKMGLGQIVSSWVGQGHNLPISAEQVQALLVSEQAQAIARKLALPPDWAREALSHVRARAVDHLTPEGEVPHNDLLDQALALFKSTSAGRCLARCRSRRAGECAWRGSCSFPGPAQVDETRTDACAPTHVGKGQVFHGRATVDFMQAFAASTSPVAGSMPWASEATICWESVRS
jgi:uncharacterized protein YidB (DUF937 family)